MGFVIGSSLFVSCTALTEIRVEETHGVLKSVDGMLCGGDTVYACPAGKSGKVTVPAGFTEIFGGAFQNCDKLTSITLPGSITRIDYWAFAGCSSLTSMKLPEGLTTIPNGAFMKCSSLKKVTIPSSVTEIDDNAFSFCTALHSISLPAGLTRLGEQAFLNSGLQWIALPKGITRIESRCFDQCTNLKTIILAANQVEIQTGAFGHADALSAVCCIGSAVQWEQAAIESGNDVLTANGMRYYFSAGDGAVSGSDLCSAARCLSGIDTADSNFPDMNGNEKPDTYDLSLLAIFLNKAN